ncbi:helix-turn-helix transcriptional regulator [Bacillus safensis]|uniref:helix-turn-helix transcriptional regulator n=1 Tax=Bacillus TaxID=1386 RepID=UPI00119E3E47|nr:MULTISPECIES: helix-turn-helix transcriptional regulator [Bacillus]MCK1972741.1 helix-turn-helix transcriptional regulator [Bacillus safensis]
MRDWLKLARENKSLLQQDVANLVGIERPYYTMLETGSRKPSVKIAKKLAEVLEIDWTLFFDDNA